MGAKTLFTVAACFCETGWVLQDDPSLMRGADVSFMTAETLSDNTGVLESPERCVEVVWSEYAEEPERKIGQYFGFRASRPPCETCFRKREVMIIMTRLVAAAVLFYGAAAFPQTADLHNLDFLLGKWIGVAGAKDTPLGAGQGAYSFEPGLDRKIIIRRNEARYDSGARHEDLMIIYLEGAPRAIYFDTEGHVIRYNLSVPSANNVVFESEASQPGPRFRLSYALDGPKLNGKFEVAPPGKPYQPYISWSSTKN